MREPDLFIANNSQEAAHVALLNELFLHAAANGVADLHFGFDEHGVRVRARVSQRLQPVGQYPRAAGQVFDEKIRSRAKMSISERKRPLSGRLRLRFVAENHFLDVRVEVTQTIDGQKISCRILDQKNSSWSLDELEMSEMVRDSIHQIVDEPNGLFLITGPTGSGKTTTLYAIINKLNVPDLNIITIENPVEYQVKGLTQIQVDDVHMGFPEALRSVLRQDPDVILVGEIRDAETAAIAVQAAITGHLVLTTLHANNSAMAITRLLELGVDPSTLAAALRGVVSQRLVRRLVPRENRTWEPPNDVEVAWMNLHGIVVKEPLFPVVGADGAHDFRGSMPLMEMIVADSAVRKAVPNGSDAIYEAACRQPSFETLAQTGTRAALAGLTTLGEVRRITSSMDAVRFRSRRLGQTLVEMGVLTVHDVHEAVVEQTRLRRSGVVRQIGRILVEKGFCSRKDVVVAMGYSADAESACRRLVEEGRLSADVLETLLAEWHERRGSLFDILLHHNYITEDDLNETSGLFV